MSTEQGKPGLLARHKALTALVALVLVLAAGCSGFALYLNSQLGNVDRVTYDKQVLPEKERPTRKPEAGEALNILLAGTDNGTSDLTLSEAVASGEWQPNVFRSDTMMVVHLDADREHVYVVSIPRDTWLHIDGLGMSKINAAFSYGGPSLMVRTVEQFTDLRIDHLAMIDWDGFKDLTTALGGVQVYIPETFYDDSQNREWTKGYHLLAGKDALQYVRTRYGLPEGDFDRINRQQNFLRQVMQDTLSSGTLSNPWRLTSVLKAITNNLTVDEEFSTADMKSLALELRDIRAGDVTFLTLPRAKDAYATAPDGESIIRLNKREAEALWHAMRTDDMESYLSEYGGSVLPDEKHVS